MSILERGRVLLCDKRFRMKELPQPAWDLPKVEIASQRGCLGIGMLDVSKRVLQGAVGKEFCSCQQAGIRAEIVGHNTTSGKPCIQSDGTRS